VAGPVAGGRADCAGTAGTARVCEPRTLTRVWWPGFEMSGPFEVGAAGGAEAAETVGAGPAAVDGPDGVVPPPAVGWAGTGEPGTGEPGTGEPGTGEPDGGGTSPPPPPAGAVTGTPPPSEPGPVETNTGVKPANGDGETVGFAIPRLAGSTRAGTLRSWVPGRASSRIAERSSTVRACIQSWADATAPAATAPT
jgi:hypothetical protein